MEPDLPRPADDPENLRRLREEAMRRVQREERGPTPVYGGPPIPPPRRFWRRWMLWALAILIAVLGWLMWHRVWPPMPVYGGPPVRAPQPPGLLMALRHIADKLG